MSAGRPPRRRGAVAAVLLLSLGTFAAVHYGLRPPGVLAHWWADGFWTLLSLAAGIKCFGTARRLSPRLARAWRFFGAGCLSWCGGMLVWSYHELVQGRLNPYPSLADLGFLGLVPPFILGIVHYRSVLPARPVTLLQIGDLGIVFTSMLLTAGIVFAEPIGSLEGSVLDVTVALAYPVLHGTAVLFGLICLWSAVHGRARTVLSLVLSAQLADAVTMWLYAHSLMGGEYRVGHYLDVAFMLVFAITIWAASEQDRAGDTAPEGRRDPRDEARVRRLEALTPALSVALVAVAAGAFPAGLPAAMPYLALPGVAFGGFLALREWWSFQLSAQLDAEVQRREARYRELVDHAPLGFFATDAAGRTAVLNARLVELLAAPGEEAVRRLDAPVDHPHVLERLRRCLERGEPWTGDVSHASPWAIRPLEVRIHLAPIRDGEAIAGAQALVEDITEGRHLEAQLRRAQKMEAVGALAGGVAHDFNNLLTGILGGVELARRDPASPAAIQGHLLEVRDAALHASELTRQLLSLTRRQEPRAAPTAINEVVRGVVRLLRRSLPETIDVRSELTPDLPLVRADAGQLQQALLNLAINARDALEASGGTITFASGLSDVDPSAVPRPDVPGGPFLVVRVIDTGTGMPAEVRDHLFEPFFTTKPPGKGTGLGLTMVSRIVEAHRGFVTVDTQPGAGSTFAVHVPCLPPGEVQDVAEVEAEPGAGGRETVLVVEDTRAVRDVVRSALEGSDYVVLTAADGLEALEVLEEQHVDLVLTDVVMPRMGGWELLRELRRRERTLPVVAMSGYSVDLDPETAVAEGFAGFLSKPFVPRTLTRLIRSVLDARRQTAGAE